MEQTKYDVFISYSRRDYVDERKNIIPGNAVSKIKEALTNAGITYWFDEEGIYSGLNFVEKIVTNIENAKILLFLSTGNANKSPWTCKEIAYADKVKKHIIPVKIDSSPYNKNVSFHIGELAYIDYYTNPQKGMGDVIKSIKAYLEELATEEKRKAEEIIKKKEEQRRQEEQKRFISEIRLLCTTLNNEEAKLELSRENLLLKTEQVLDKEQRAELLGLINNGGAIHRKYKKNIAELIKEIDNLKSTRTESLKLDLQSKEKKILQLQSDLASSRLQGKKTSNFLNGRIIYLQNKVKALQEENEDENVHTKRYLLIIFILFFAVLGLIIFTKITQKKLEIAQEKLETAQEKLETSVLLSDDIPFYITDINVKNQGSEWGDELYSSTSTYFVPRIKYIVLKEGTYDLKIKIYDNTGKLSRDEKKSPAGYSYSESITTYDYDKQHYKTKTLIGWGNKNPGYWPMGTYRIEIWYKNKKMSEKTFHVVDKISDVTPYFGNGNIN